MPGTLVINNSRVVAGETRLRVEAAMEELHYRPNALARSLRRGQTHTLGVILPDISNPFFADKSRPARRKLLPTRLIVRGTCGGQA